MMTNRALKYFSCLAVAMIPVLAGCQKKEAPPPGTAPIQTTGSVTVFPEAPAKAAPATEEQSKFTVVLTEVAADRKISVIKEVRAITQLGLKEAKDLVEGAPQEVVKDVNKEDAARFKKQLEEAGGKAEVK